MALVERKCKRRPIACLRAALGLGALLLLLSAAPVVAYADGPHSSSLADSPSTASFNPSTFDGLDGSDLRSGWVTRGGETYYYRFGMKLTGQQKIGRSYYFFDKAGRMETGTAKSGGTTYYLSKSGKMEAYAKKGKFYKPTGKRMAADEARDYKAQLKARRIVAKLTTEDMTKSQKLRVCFNWIKKAPYHIYHRFKNVRGWSSDFANDHFTRKFQGKRCSDCNADAAALGYFALAIGYKDVRVHINKKSHGFTQIDGKFYDPYYAKRRSFSKYYGVKKGWAKKYTAKLLVPSEQNGYATVKYLGKKPKAKKAASATSKKDGLKKEDGAYVCYVQGKKVKSAWKKIGSSTYYFDKKGRAATGSVPIKGTYYVFSNTGKLQKGSGTRVVKVVGEKYRVSASGAARPGWDGEGKTLYLRNGRQAVGLSVYRDQLYWFDDKGVYDVEKTGRIRAAAKPNQEADELLSLMDEPIKRRSDPSCHPLVEELGAGEDVTYLFKNAKVVLFRASDGRLFYESHDYRE